MDINRLSSIASRILFIAAFALLGLGDREGAKASLEQYVSLAPEAADAAQMRNLIKSLK